MNETNHILKRIFSYSPPLQVCGKTKNEIKTTYRNLCAQAGFVIRFRYRTSGKIIAPSKWLSKNHPTGNGIHGLF